MAHKILVVDDEPDIVELLRYNLETDGHEVLHANNGLEALQVARKQLPDLILLDLMLPDLDGFSIREILHCQPATTRIPIILLTAMAGEMPRLHGLEVGAADYCIKPVSPRDLKIRVRGVLARRATSAPVDNRFPLVPPAEVPRPY